MRRITICTSWVTASNAARTATVWVGSIPETAISVPEQDSRLLQAIGAFGDVVSATCRSKPGQNKSWALVRKVLTSKARARAVTDFSAVFLQITFRDVMAVDKLLQAAVTLKDDSVRKSSKSRS